MHVINVDYFNESNGPTIMINSKAHYFPQKSQSAHRHRCTIKKLLKDKEYYAVSGSQKICRNLKPRSGFRFLQFFD